jgi:6-phosphogluconolactonase
VPLGANETLLIGSDAAEAARLAASRVVETLALPGDSRSVALAGGSTPAQLYSLLAEPPWRERVPWDSVHWFWGDERIVPPDHSDSNYRMAMEKLLRPLNIPADRIHRMPTDESDLDSAADLYECTIRSVVTAGGSGIPAFDLILLGIGNDGHTASLFPDSQALRESKRLVVPNFAPSQNAWRMTLTFPLLAAARHLLFLVTGSGKAEVMTRILASTIQDDRHELPAAILRDASAQITWVLDRDAAEVVVASGLS